MFQIVLLLIGAFICAQASALEGDDGFIFLGNHFNKEGRGSKYYLSSAANKKSLKDARDDCFNNEYEGDKRKLVIIEDRDEANTLRLQLGTWGVEEKVWTAAEMYDGEWIWYDWATNIITDCNLCNENLSGGKEEDGAAIGGIGMRFGWEVSEKNELRRFICEAVEDEPITDPATEQSTEQTTKLITEQTTTPSTEQTTKLTTEQTTKLITEQTTTPSTEKTTELITEKTTRPPPTGSCGQEPSPPIDFSCTGKPDGNYGNPNNCCSYLACVAGQVKYTMPCSKGLHYDWRSMPGQDVSHSYCNYPNQAHCPLIRCQSSWSTAWCSHDSHCCSGRCKKFYHGFGHCA